MQDTVSDLENCKVKTKKCRTCGEDVPLTEYPIRKGREGYTPPDCKKCNNTRRKKDYELNADKCKVASKVRREGHKDEIAAYLKVYRESHREEAKIASRCWYKKNREYALMSASLYAEKHTEHKHEYNHKYYLDHKEAISAYKVKYNNKNYAHVIARGRAYCKSPKGKEVSRAKKARRRQLGFNPINRIFEGSSYHHLRFRDETGRVDNDIGIYIPTTLHESVRHNGNTGRNMDLINHTALSWYISNTQISDLNELALELCKHYNIAVEITA